MRILQLQAVIAKTRFLLMLRNDDIFLFISNFILHNNIKARKISSKLVSTDSEICVVELKGKFMVPEEFLCW